MIYEFNHVGVFVRDLDATMTFYRDLLGARLASEAFIPASETDCVYVQLAGGLIEFLHPRNPAPGTVFGLNHIAFMSDDLDGDFARLAAAGAPALTAPKVAGSGRGRLAFVADPNGVRVELLQREDEFRTAPVDGPIEAVTQVSIAADDLPAAEEFYRNRLSMTRRDGHGGDASTVAHYGLGPDTLELRAADRSADAARIRSITLAATDLNELLPALRTAGATIDSPSASAGGDNAEAVEMRDPDGVRIRLTSARS